MALPVLDDGALAVGGVTVGAAMEAGVVGADVDALDAATGLALTGVFSAVDPAAEQRLDQLVVDALAMGDAEVGEIHGLGAGLHGHVEVGGGLRHKGCQLIQHLMVFWRLAQFRSQQVVHDQPLDRVQVLLRLLVEVDHADDDPVGLAGQEGGNLVKEPLVLGQVDQVAQQDGVVAPDDLVRADPV